MKRKIAVLFLSVMLVVNVVPSAFAKDYSILNDSTVKSLMNSCPSIMSKTGKSTEIYSPKSYYYENFSSDSTIDTWRIVIDSNGVYFSDNKNTGVYVMQNKGKADEVVPVLRWEIKLLKSIPQIEQTAKQLGIRFYAQRINCQNNSFSKFADDAGVIDFTNEYIREQYISSRESDLDLMEVFGALREALK